MQSQSQSINIINFVTQLDRGISSAHSVATRCKIAEDLGRRAKYDNGKCDGMMVSWYATMNGIYMWVRTGSLLLI